MSERLAALPAAAPAPAGGAPWWRHGHVWLLIAGPAAVVLAGIATMVLAVRTPDPVLAEDYYRRGLEINRTLAERQSAAQMPAPVPALMPAQQARNHAATPHGAPSAQAPR